MNFLLFFCAVASWWAATHLFSKRTTKPLHLLACAALYLAAGALSLPLLGYYGVLLGILYSIFVLVTLWVVSPYRKHKHGHTPDQRLTSMHENFPTLNILVGISVIFSLVNRLLL